MRQVSASAPARIDLAGGTVDIWPVSLLTEGALTVNAAIDLYARCRARPRRDGRLIAISRDQGARISRPLSRPVRRGEPLELIVRIARELAPGTGVTLETACAAPAGSGLGGSSALAIAVVGAIASLAGARIGRSARLTLARDLETQVLGIPAGEQDYYAAIYGGVAAIEWGPGGGRRRRLSVDLGELRRHCLLCYSGSSRNSGASNWDMVRRRIDGDSRAARAFRGVVEAASRMRRALTAGDWKAAGAALELEMENRSMLSPLVSAGPIAEILETARRAGAWGGKVCGAGGGGCVVFLAPADRIPAIEQALVRKGSRPLQFQFVRGGMIATSNTTSRFTGAQYPLRATQ